MQAMNREPIVLIPGLACTPRYYAAQTAALWRFGAVMVANHTAHDSMAALADAVLAGAPPRFALAGHSMGGYLAFEILRRAPSRVTRLALLDTSARPDTPEQTANRRRVMALAAAGRFAQVNEELMPNYVHEDRRDDPALRAIITTMADEVGAEAFIRQENAIIGRADSRPTLGAIDCPTLVLVGDADRATPPDRSQEIAAGIRGATLVVVPGSGHMTTIERPEAVTAAMVEWMSMAAPREPVRDGASSAGARP
jgi:pimeloyl-ACP methyl ester carboxylesterase